MEESNAGKLYALLVPQRVVFQTSRLLLAILFLFIGHAVETHNGQGEIWSIRNSYENEVQEEIHL